MPGVVLGSLCYVVYSSVTKVGVTRCCNLWCHPLYYLKTDDLVYRGTDGQRQISIKRQCACIRRRTVKMMSRMLLAFVMRCYNESNADSEMAELMNDDIKRTVQRDGTTLAMNCFRCLHGFSGVVREEMGRSTRI